MKPLDEPNGHDSPNGQEDVAHIGPVQDFEEIDMAGARLSIVGRMGLGDDGTVLIRSRMNPGGSVPLHSHHDPELFYILNGSMEVFLNDDTPRWHPVGEGQSLLIEPDVKHAIRNSSDEPVEMILATTVRLARFFREVGRPARGSEHGPPTLYELQHLKRKAAEYNYWLASPEESAAATG